MMALIMSNGNILMLQGGLRLLTLKNLLTAPPGHIPAAFLMLYCLKNSIMIITSKVFAKIE